MIIIPHDFFLEINTYNINYESMLLFCVHKGSMNQSAVCNTFETSTGVNNSTDYILLSRLRQWTMHYI